jgi:hypothetical protein
MYCNNSKNLKFWWIINQDAQRFSVPDILDAASKVQPASGGIIVPVQVKRKDLNLEITSF